MNWQEIHLHNLATASSDTEFFKVLVGIASESGFDYCAYGMRMPVPVTQPKMFMLNNYSTAWQERYASQNYLAIDPTVRHGMKSVEPLIWAESGQSKSLPFWSDAHDPDWKSYKAFLIGMKLFDEKHALAPAAPLRFVLSPRVANATLDGVRMNIEDDDGGKIPVAIEANGTFVLPRDEEAARKGAEIVLNKKRKTLSWRPDFHTPGVPENARRMGDLRLECFVRWSIEQADLIAFFRSTINAFGGLHCMTQAGRTIRWCSSSTASAPCERAGKKSCAACWRAHRVT